MKQTLLKIQRYVALSILNKLRAYVLDANRREIQLGDKLADLSGEWYADDETPVVESEGDELCIYVEGTTIYLSEIETEKTCLIVD